MKVLGKSQRRGGKSLWAGYDVEKDRKKVRRIGESSSSQQRQVGVRRRKMNRVNKPDEEREGEIYFLIQAVLGSASLLVTQGSSNQRDEVCEKLETRLQCVTVQLLKRSTTPPAPGVGRCVCDTRR